MRRIFRIENSMKRIDSIVAIVLLSSLTLFAQTAEPGSKPETSAPPAQSDATTSAPKPVISQTARLNAAKTVYIKRAEAHNDIPFNVIANGFDGWAKYMVVSSPEKADLIIEVSATEREEAGFTMSAQQTPGVVNNKSDEPAKVNKIYTVSNIRMVVIDSHTKTPVWAGNEQPRSAARKNKSEDNVVEAAQRLFQHFHDRVEPPAAQ
jgi:hypothetical protein